MARAPWSRGVLLALPAALIALLICAPSALATPVTCANLATAISTASAGDVLQLPAGTCTTNLGVSNTAAFTLEGDPGGGTILKPSDTTIPIIFANMDVHLTLSNLTFTGTTAASALLLDGTGEAVTVTGDTFTNNAHQSGFGAGISIEEGGDTATSPTKIIGNTFTLNNSTEGGAVAVIGPRHLLLSGNTFSGNSSSGDAGAVIFRNLGPTSDDLQIDHNQFVGNSSRGPGGALEIEHTPGQPVELSSNLFQDNKITGSHAALGEREGGAVFLGLGSADAPYVVAQSNNAFVGNLIDETQSSPSPELPEGGAAEWSTGVNVQSSGDSFIDNRVAVNDGGPPEGGAVGAFASAPSGPSPARPGVFAGTNDLFSGNSTAAGGWGGAIYVGGHVPSCTGVCPPSSVTLHSSTVVNNSVDPGGGSEGGAIWGSPADGLAIDNSIVSGNSPGPELFGFGANPPVIGFSDVCTEAGGPVVPSGAGNICASPLLGASGAETISSPTIDAGSNALLPAGLSGDIAGNPRVAANRLTCSGLGPAVTDMGAFEFVGPGVAPACAPNPLPKVKIAGGRLTLRHGKVAIKLTCPPIGSACIGTLVLDTRKAFASAAATRHKKRKPIKLGSARFNIASGRHKTVQVKVSRKTLRRLKGRRAVAVVVKVSAHDTLGAKAASSHKTTLVLRPKPKRKR